MGKPLYSHAYRYKDCIFRYNISEGVLELIEPNGKVIDGQPVLRRNWERDYQQYIQEFYDRLTYRG